jgi:hypothetical protein
MPTGNNIPPGQYYAVPSGVTDLESHQSTLFPQAIRSTSVAHNHSSDDRHHYNAEPPFLALLTKTSHCSKFKKFLEESVQMKSDSLASLELFVNGIKSALEMSLCSHYSIPPYNEWALDYLVTTTICPQHCMAIQDTQ